MIATLAASGVGTYYILYYAGYLAAVGLAAVAVRIFGRRLPYAFRIGATAIVAILCLRLVLLDNPWMLTLYRRTLTVESLGLRQDGVLDLEIRKYRRDLHQPKLANLAVGSSQVGAIFYQWARPPAEPFGVYSLAGMKTLDYVLNQEAIAARNPARVILYLSAFDMTGSPELFSLPLAPSQPLTMWSVYGRLRAAALTSDETAANLQAYFFSQLLPEYRYSFVYRALLREWMGAAPRIEPPTGRRLTAVASYWDPQWLGYNFQFFDAFLRFCQSRGIEVLVNEGQINPKVRTPEIDRLNRLVRSRIEDLQPVFPNLRYVPAADIYEFAATDYQDNTHVLPDAAKRYTARLAAHLARGTSSGGG